MGGQLPLWVGHLVVTQRGPTSQLTSLDSKSIGIPGCAGSPLARQANTRPRGACAGVSWRSEKGRVGQ